MTDEQKSPDTPLDESKSMGPRDLDKESHKAEVIKSQSPPVKKKVAKKAAKKSAKKSSKKAAAKKAAKKTDVESDSLELPGFEDQSVEKNVESASLEMGEKTSEDLPKIKEVEEKKEDLPPPPPRPEVPDTVDLNEFRTKPLSELYQEIEKLPLRIPAQANKSQLIFLILSCFAKHGTRITASGILEMVNENYGMLRDPKRSFRPEADDLYVSSQFLKEHGFREGQSLEVLVREPRGRDKYLSVSELLKIEKEEISSFSTGAPFDFLTSLFPEERFVLERGEEGGLAVRVVDLIAPLGKGQRGLIVAPPRGGKTILLKQIAQSIQANHPESELIVLLLDERPEEVTDFEDMVGENVYASTFDEASKRHAQVAKLVLERARRLVEQKKDVIILLDSLTRLARGYNNAVRGGPIGSGGISPKAIAECRKFFGAARNVEEGGSLTILATCLVETENRMDDVIFEELKGTGNMEIRLDQILAEQRIFPAIHIPQSGTRNDDRLYHEQEFPRVLEIRRHLAALPIGEALETLLRHLSKTESNTELVLKGMR